jgi:4-amino-4-deoxy-L-arabinose transferase-like glycosyltransferase
MSRWAPLLLVAGAAALYLFRLGWVALYDDDESLYAEICREMLASRNWLTPSLDFIPYLEKPPLLYWLNAAAARLLGLSDFAARLPTALASIAGVICVYGMGRDLWGRRSGLAAGGVLATSFGYFIFGRMVMPDMLFAVLLTAAFWGFGRALLDESASRYCVWGGYAAMAGAVMAKGLIGLIFPSLALGAFVLLTGDWRQLRRLEIARGGALFLLIAVPWHAVMELQHPGFLGYYFVDKHLYRFLGHPELLSTVSLPVPTFLAMTLVWFCPWSAFLPAALVRCWPGSRPGRSDRGFLLVMLWAGSVIGFFSLSSSRLEYYALPALPALALCVGRLWDTELDPARRAKGRGGMGATWLALIGLAACMVPAALLFPRLEHMRFYNLFPLAALPADPSGSGILATARVYDVPGFASLVPLLESVAAVIAAGIAVSSWAWFGGRPRAAFSCLVVAMAAGLLSVERGFQLYAPYRSVEELAGWLRIVLQPGDKIVIEGKYDHHAGLGYYTGEHILIYRGLQGILVNGTRYVGTLGTFIGDSELEHLWKGPGRVYYLSDEPGSLRRLRGLAPSTLVVGRTGNSWLLENGTGGFKPGAMQISSLSAR